MIKSPIGINHNKPSSPNKRDRIIGRPTPITISLISDNTEADFASPVACRKIVAPLLNVDRISKDKK